MRMHFIALSLSSLGCGASMPRIHEYAKQGKIHPRPAIYAREEIDVNARANKVWALLADIEAWPTWMADAKDVRLHGPFAVDTEFELTNLGMSARSKLAIIEDNRTLGWTGTASIAKTAVIWRLSEVNGSTHISVDESIDGFMLGIFYSKEKAAIEIRKRLQQIKVAAEK